MGNIKVSLSEKEIEKENIKKQLLKIEKEKKIGLTAGASAPDILIQDFIDKISQVYDVEIKNISVADENITFKIPRELNER